MTQRLTRFLFLVLLFVSAAVSAAGNNAFPRPEELERDVAFWRRISAGNASLALAIQKAKDNSMPKDNIERAVAKGAGTDKDAAAVEEVVYEGYGPAGVALLIHCYTDNRNRTGADVRSILSKNGGSLGEPGSVAYVFEKKGSVVVEASAASEDDLMVAIDAGAEDIVEDGDHFEVVSDPHDFVAVRAAIEEAGIPVASADVIQRPKTRVEVEDKDAAKVFRVIELL